MNNLTFFRDTAKTSVFPASEVASAAQDLEMEGFRKASSSNQSKQDDLSQQGNIDALSSMLNYTQQREAIMSYYFLDEKNQVKVRFTLKAYCYYNLPQTTELQKLYGLSNHLYTTKLRHPCSSGQKESQQA